MLVTLSCRDDLVDMIIEAIKKPSYSGVYNGTAPKPVTMAQLCSSVGGVLGRPSWLPVPDFAITTLLGEGAQVSMSARSNLCSLVGGCLDALLVHRLAKRIGRAPKAGMDCK
jgi:NAD dependent epimerase/dehydratase family enzyme